MGIYSECHACRQLSEEALSYVRRRERYLRSVEPAYDEFDARPDEDVAVSLADLNEAL